MKKFFLLLLVFFSCTYCCWAQSFYICESSVYNAWTIQKVTATNTGYQTTLIDPGPFSDTFFSIAVQGNFLYYINLSSELIKAEIAGNKLINYETLLPTGAFGNALTIAKDGTLYWVSGNTLYKYDQIAQKATNLGSLPYSASGDLMFYKNDLYMAAYEGIIKINLNSLSQSSVYISIPNGYNIFGLASYPVSTTKNKYIALSSSGLQTSIIELDMENRAVSGITGSIPFSALDAASEVEDGTFTNIEVSKIQQFTDCNNAGNGIVKVVTKPHTATYTYQLNGGTSNTTGIFYNVAPGAYNLKITSPNEVVNQTFAVASIINAKPITNVTKTNAMCDAKGQITLDLATGGDIYKIKYGNQVYTNNRLTLTGLEAGLYHFDILNEFNCPVDAVDVTIVRDKCTIKLDAVDIQQQCDAVKKGTINVKTKPHAGVYTFSFNGQTNTTGVFNNINPGDYVLKITSDEDETIRNITVPNYGLTEPIIVYKKTNPFCADKGSITFNLTAGYQVKFNGTVYSSDYNFKDLEVGVYHFTILKPNGCISDILDVSLIYEPCPIEIETVSVTPECNVLGKGVIQVTGKTIPETYTYYLSTGQNNHTGTFNMLSPGVYIVKVTASGGNTPKQVSLIVPDYNLGRPSYKTKLKNAICDLPGSITFNVTTNPELYDIEFRSVIYPSTYTFENLSAGNYYFKILKKDGCIANEATVNLKLDSCNPVTFPNTFSPNGDGNNDIFKPNQDSRATRYQLDIFSRYGRMLFTSRSLTNGWDGQINGNMAPTGVYYWVVTYVNDVGKPVTQNGYITLIK